MNRTWCLPSVLLRCMGFLHVLAILGFPAALLASPVGGPPCATGADYQAEETRCDGIDNDCDGLVDFLLPTEANACRGAAPSCASGHATCHEGARLCLAPGPAPEVFDDVDNDCNGVIDDAPSHSGRARALLLVPGYVFSDGPLEIDNIASILEQWGIPFDRPTVPGEFDSALATLSQYPLVVVPGYLEEGFLTPHRQAALEAYANSGGVLVLYKPIFEPGSATHGLIGSQSTIRRNDVDAIVFNGPSAFATRAFDSPEERRLPLAGVEPEGSAYVHVFTPADEGTQPLAYATAGGADIGAVVLRRSVGRGAVYSLGHNLHSSRTGRCYINCFEPAGDLSGLFLREAFREGTSGHVVLKHTVPGAEDSVAILSHDVDAQDAQEAGPDWGEPGALQVAALEQEWGARGSFLITTAYVTTDVSVAYYSPALVTSLCALGMCPVGAHSVVHGLDFGGLVLGTCTEQAASYRPDLAPTLCGEVNVSMELLTAASGVAPVAWRSPYLLVHPEQYDVMAANGILYDSSYAIGDLAFNLPISLARTGINQAIFHGRPLYSMPIALEDGLSGVEGRQEMSADNAAKFVSVWSYVMLRNAANNAHTMSLLHPSFGAGAQPDNIRNKLTVLDGYIQACRTRGVKVDATMADIAQFWRAREASDVDASYTPGRYEGAIRTGANAPLDLTLEFGDNIAAFVCPSCGPANIVGKRVVLRGPLTSNSTHAFHANVLAPAPVPASGRPSIIIVSALLLLLGLRRTALAGGNTRANQVGCA